VCSLYNTIKPFQKQQQKRSAAGYFAAADPLLFKQCAARLTEPLNHFVCLFDAQPEIITQALDAHAFFCAAVDHLAVEPDVVIGQQL
jgi:hypothetical protein